MKRYMIVGVGSRSRMYLDAVTGPFSGDARIVALCDSNPHRLDLARTRCKERGASTVCGGPTEFESLISAQSVDTVVVTTIDRTHDEYIVRAFEAGCDVIVEKPLTIDPRRLARIEECRRRTGRSLRVTFNYRYAPRNSIIRELLQVRRAIGRVRSVHFEWLLDTRHGADYFRRWHRDKRNSGGLLIHKATHHFDLVNWWLDDTPLRVFASGDLVFYGRENAERRGMSAFPSRGTDAPADDPFALDLTADPELKKLYWDAEQYDGYRRDENVFGNYISIEDDMAVLVDYRGGATLSYHLTAYSPWEGFRVAFNGEGGRIEYEVVESTMVSGSATNRSRTDRAQGEEPWEDVSIRVIPLFGATETISVPGAREVGHGGGDRRLLEDIFAPTPGEDPLGRAADLRAGINSVAVGIAGNLSMAAGRAVMIEEILPRG
ncbi:MAG: Gfo/Idh/MocA family oxidoreductase [Spirochaetales bacterium]|nr:Gfo/Idh/MocA family oxidoreductase [Spirochaetales bacterium]